MKSLAFIFLLLTGCAVRQLPPQPDLNPTHAPHIVSIFSRAAPQSVILPPSAATIAFVTMDWPVNVNLTWLPPMGANDAGYHLYWGAASRQYTHMVASATLFATATNLTPGVTNYFAATALDSEGNESDFSPELIYCPPAPGYVRLHFPAAPYGIQSSPDLVNWTDRPDAIQTNGDWFVTH